MTQVIKKVIDKIKGDKIKMKPRFYFIAKVGLLVLGIAVITLFVLYLVSFIFFVLRATGALEMHRFGMRGIRASFMLWPWVLIAVVIILIIILELLIKYCSFVYRRPIFYSIAFVFLLAVVGGFAIDRTSLHRNIFQRAQERGTPFAGRFYRNYGLPEIKDTHRGIVIESGGDRIAIKENSGTIHDVFITSATKLIPPGFEIKVDDEIMVLGKEANGEVRALGIRKVENDFNFFPRPTRRLPPRPMVR